MKPSIHIVGCPRSGTTLLAEMINACYPGIEYPRHEETILDVYPDSRRTRMSKKPNDGRWIKPVLKVNQGLHVLAMIRDPRSVLASRHRALPGMYFCNYPVWKRSEKSIAALRSHCRVLVVRYEDLVSAPEREQDRIGRFLDFLVPEYSFADYHEIAAPSSEAIHALDGVRPPDPARRNAWKEHLPRIKQQIERFPTLLDDLVRLGYEVDHEWTRMLGEIHAREFPCRYSDRGARLKQLEQALRKKVETLRYLRKLKKAE